MRHGEAEGNLYRRMQGQYNSSLTELGYRQEEAVGKRFLDIPLDAVYSSDLYRAMDTASALCLPKRLPLHTDVRFREVNVGPWEELPFGTAWRINPKEMDDFTNHPDQWRLEGMRLKGTVSSIVDFGAFVDLGGIDGLVHISELSWNHVNHPSEVVKVGDEVEVEVLDVDLQRERISLGLKQTTEDPWIKLVESYPVGTIVDGKVTKIVPFGAFIELGQSIEGLVHISEMSQRHIDTPAQVVKAGDEVKVKVMEINPERRRISLSMKAAAEELGFEIEVDESIQAEEKPAKKKAEKKEEAAPAEAPAEEPAAE